ncbi:FAD-binding oxidoreductase [Flavihumibacter petaseus]|uniref:Putative oxidoreductase n=1 Tax=Flavihumibacter petaseus NBRC 106054 TaxID=1220578 RepID=A0A0E9N3F3_9BACT|nr:FAD-binding oxidoreductase [Flavihumibacter petaseus]GAO43870.1 putative oxidoreductase [Flavihumibacter petaseus NBRC 106054]
MPTHRVTLTEVKPVTHDVKSFHFTRPDGYEFVPGQATDVNLVDEDWKQEKRPFTFTGLTDARDLSFTIKGYPDHHGVTDKLHHLKAGDQIEIDDPWGAISYKGPGYFIAGGAGITPFIAIFRDLHRKGQLIGNTLFFSNKTAKDIILKEELIAMLGDKAIFILSQEAGDGYPKGRIDEAFLRDQHLDLKKHFYICGPDPMIQQITATLEGMGANPEAVVFEK